MAKPEWIDEALSEQLPLLRDRGEGQHLEFMISYPSNGNELSKEIAAFASSNAGTILIGVADDGALVGLENVDTPRGRDSLCQRIEGVCSGNVRPAITPAVKFAKEENAIVLAIEVPRGSQPIYYNRNTPYVRHLSRSRPADPHEVIERIAEWIKRNPLTAPDSDDAGSRFLSTLAGTLIDVLIYGNELEERNINPWLDLMRTQLGSAGEELRYLAAQDSAVEMGLDGKLRQIADNLEAAANHRLVLGGDSWKVLTGYVSDAVKGATALKARHIDTVPLSADSRTEIADMIRQSTRELSDLDRRAESMVDDGRVEEFQEAASRIGRLLLIAGHYELSEEDRGYAGELHALGRALHLLETERLYMDGGQSMTRIVQHVHDLNGRLQDLMLQKEL